MVGDGSAMMNNGQKCFLIILGYIGRRGPKTRFPKNGEIPSFFLRTPLKKMGIFFHFFMSPFSAFFRSPFFSDGRLPFFFLINPCALLKRKKNLPFFSEGRFFMPPIKRPFFFLASPFFSF